MAARSSVVHKDAMLRRFTGPLKDILSADGVNEVMINRPHEVFVETHGEIAPFDDRTRHFTYDNLMRTAILIAKASGQGIGPEKPLLSASLLDGERVQVVLPPACPPGEVVLSIRKPNATVVSLEDYRSAGVFEQTRKSTDTPRDPELVKLRGYYENNDFYAFLHQAIKTRRNIIVSGETGSGKTTLTNGLIQAIQPEHRIITIEDVREVVVTQPNYVHLLVSKGKQSKANISIADLVQACLRLNPTRIMLSELRGPEAFDFLNAINTAHNGSITSIHANSAMSVYERLVTMIKQSEQGRDMKKPEIIDYCRSVIDVIVHFEKRGPKRVLSEVHFEDRVQPRAA